MEGSAGVEETGAEPSAGVRPNPIFIVHRTFFDAFPDDADLSDVLRPGAGGEESSASTE